MHLKYGWKLKEYSTVMLQTEEVYLYGERSEALKEYERYFGPKLGKRTGQLMGVS